jgi:hypothetical protein
MFVFPANNSLFVSLARFIARKTKARNRQAGSSLALWLSEEQLVNFVFNETQEPRERRIPKCEMSREHSGNQKTFFLSDTLDQYYASTLMLRARQRKREKR